MAYKVYGCIISFTRPSPFLKLHHLICKNWPQMVSKKVKKINIYFWLYMLGGNCTPWNIVLHDNITLLSLCSPGPNSQWIMKLIVQKLSSDIGPMSRDIGNCCAISLKIFLSKPIQLCIVGKILTRQEKICTTHV